MENRCPACGTDHDAGARFCSSCGASLRQACRACGAEQPAAASFCSSCGAALEAGARRAGVEDEHEERRVVTVLFADLAGSTALGERLDPEDVRTLQGELYDLVNAEVERFGGATEKFVGDAVLAVFGAPQAHDDDPERAVRAALAVRERFPAFAASVEARYGLPVGLRAGVTTGEVVAGREAAARGELMVSGDAVNVAARLQQRAEPGQVLVGTRTHAATRRSIAYRALGAEAARGKRDPVEAWEALETVAAPGRRGVDGLAAPMIGRDDELAILRALTDRVAADGAPQLVTLFGPAGVGKSRLLSEFVGTLPEARLLTGRCLAYGDGITFWPLAEVAKGAAQILDSEPADVALAKLRASVEAAVGGDDETVLRGLAWTIGLNLPSDGETDPGDVRAVLEDAWSTYLAALGRGGLTLLGVEDVHWASEPLLDLLERLLERLEQCAVLVVCTARPEFAESHPGWGSASRNVTSLSLAPLTPADAADLLEELLGASLPERAAARVLEQAEGNPFYVEEIVHMLIEQGAIARENGGWAARESLAEAAIPDSVHGVIAARLDLLESGAREALRRCSVMGREFWPAAVGVDEGLIGALVRRRLVSERPSSVAGMREFAFKHALSHDVAYSTLPRAERRELHRRVGEWVERVAVGREAETAELAAYHYERAIEYGDDDPVLAAGAHAMLRAAGEAAHARAALATADSLFRRALALAPGNRERAATLVALGRSELGNGQLEESLAHLDAALELALTLDDARLTSDALSWRSRVCWLTGRWKEALASATSAIEALAGLPETVQLARALARRSQIEMLRGLPEAEAHSLEAIEAGRRLGDEQAELNARINLLTARANKGVPPDDDDVREIVRRAAAAGLNDEAHRAVANMIWSAQAYRHADEVEAIVAELRETLAAVPPVENFREYIEVSLAALLHLPTGRWDALDDEARNERLPPRFGGTMVRLELLGGLALRRGDLAAAGVALRELRDVAIESGEAQRIVPMASVVLPLAALTDDTTSYDLALSAVLRVEGREWEVMPTAGIPRALAAVGDAEGLERIAELLGPEDPAALSVPLRVARLLTTGLLATLGGRPQAGIEPILAAVELERARGWHYRAACLETELARVLETSGRRQEAAAARGRAAAVLGPLGVVNPY